MHLGLLTGLKLQNYEFFVNGPQSKNEVQCMVKKLYFA